MTGRLKILFATITASFIATTASASGLLSDAEYSSTPPYQNPEGVIVASAPADGAYGKSIDPVLASYLRMLDGAPLSLLSISSSYADFMADGANGDRRLRHRNIDWNMSIESDSEEDKETIATDSPRSAYSSIDFIDVYHEALVRDSVASLVLWEAGIGGDYGNWAKPNKYAMQRLVRASMLRKIKWGSRPVASLRMGRKGWKLNTWASSGSMSLATASRKSSWPEASRPSKQTWTERPGAIGSPLYTTKAPRRQ